MKLQFADAVIFFALIAINVLFGASFFFRNRTTDQFTTGGKKLPSWAVGMSIFATFVSSISFLALPGKAFTSNWNAFVFSLSIPAAAWLAVRFFVPLYRSTGSVSAYYYLEKRFGRWAGTYASACYILTQLMRTGAILMLLALPLNALFGWNIKVIIILTGAGVTLYSMLGGIQAVIWTDAIQGIILIAGAVASALFLTFSMPEGPVQILETAGAADKFSLGSFGTDLTESTFWVVLVYGLFINIQNYGIDQNYIQRYLSARTEREAKRSALFGSLIYIPVSMVFFYIGTALFAFYSVQPGLLPEELKLPGSGDKVFPYFIVKELPTGITGLLIAAIFSAGMSTVSTSLNSTATIVLTDYYNKYFNRYVSEKKSMKVLYLSSFFTGTAGVLIALLLTGVESALDAWWSLASIFSGGMLGLFLLGFISRKVRNADAVAGVIAGVIVIIWMSLSSFLLEDGKFSGIRSSFHSNLTIVFGTVTIFLVGFLLNRLFSNIQKNLKMKSILLSAIMIATGGIINSQSPFQGGQCVIKSEFIYQPSDVIFPSCHASTICQTSEGMLAAWFGGTAEGNSDVSIWTSRFINGKWSLPEEAANGIQHKTKRYPCWNPVLYNMGDTVLLFYKVGPGPSAWWGEVKYSQDNGRTWSVSRRLPEDILGPVKNKPVKLKNGELLCPSSSESDGWRLHMEFTSGPGISWERTPPLNEREIFAIQPSVLFHPGSIQLLCRTKQSKIFTAWSNDNGRQWTKLIPLCLPNPDAGIDALTLANGKFLVIYNHLSAGRHMLNTAISENGTDWKAAALLENGPRGSEYSYPAVIQTDDGLIHITYTWERRLIKHVIIDPEKITCAPVVNGKWPEQ